MKTISLKKFRKSAERMTRAQYEKESGNETQSPEVYCYVNFLQIEVHQLKREVGEPMKELYVVHTSDSFESESLIEAEKYLYKRMKSELPKKKEVEKIDSSKYPNGLESWLDANYEITHAMGYHTAKRDSELIEAVSDDEARKELASRLTTEFELSFDGVEFHEKMSAFVMAKLSPKEIVDPRMPNGLGSFLEAYHQIASFIGFQTCRYIRGKKVLQANLSVEEFNNSFSTYEQVEEVSKLATEFEKRLFEFENREDKGEGDYDHLEEIDNFCAEKFPSEGEIKVIYSMSDTEYEISSYMGANRNTPLFESLDGADGQHTKAIELSKEFDLKFKDVEWGENGVGSFYEMLDEFLKNTFYPPVKKSYVVKGERIATTLTYIKASSEEEAIKMAKSGDYPSEIDSYEDNNPDAYTIKGELNK